MPEPEDDHVAHIKVSSPPKADSISMEARSWAEFANHVSRAAVLTILIFYINEFVKFAFKITEARDITCELNLHSYLIVQTSFLGCIAVLALISLLRHIYFWLNAINTSWRLLPNALAPIAIIVNAAMIIFTIYFVYRIDLLHDQIDLSSSVSSNTTLLNDDACVSVAQFCAEKLVGILVLTVITFVLIMFTKFLEPDEEFRELGSSAFKRRRKEIKKRNLDLKDIISQDVNEQPPDSDLATKVKHFNLHMDEFDDDVRSVVKGKALKRRAIDDEEESDVRQTYLDPARLSANGGTLVDNILHDLDRKEHINEDELFPDFEHTSEHKSFRV